MARAEGCDLLVFVSQGSIEGSTGPIGDYFGMSQLRAALPRRDVRVVHFNDPTTIVTLADDDLDIAQQGGNPVRLGLCRSFVYFPASFEPEDVALRPPGGHGPWEHFLHRQWRVVAEFIEHRLATLRSCINDPVAARQASNKPVQAVAVSRRGLRMPRLTVTNDPALVRRIAAAGPIVRKSISEAPSPAGTPLAQTSAVLADSLDGWSLPAAAPLAYQSLVETPWEVRFYVVGDEIIAVEIDRDGSATDIRFQPDASRTARLSDRFAEFNPRLVALVDDLGLSFAAIDALPAGDDLLILEINPNGTWRKYPEDVVCRIDAAFVALLERQINP